MEQRVVLVYSGIHKNVENDVKKKILDLGGDIRMRDPDDLFPRDVTRLIVGELQNNHKVHTALALGIPILDVSYVNESRRFGSWLPNFEDYDIGHPRFLDKTLKSKMNISPLGERRERRQSGGIFKDWTVLVVLENNRKKRVYDHLITLGGGSVEQWTRRHLADSDPTKIRLTGVFTEPTMILDTTFSIFLDRNCGQIPVISCLYLESTLTRNSQKLSRDEFSIFEERIVKFLTPKDHEKRDLLLTRAAEYRKKNSAQGRPKNSFNNKGDEIEFAGFQPPLVVQPRPTRPFSPKIEPEHTFPSSPRRPLVQAHPSSPPWPSQGTPPSLYSPPTIPEDPSELSQNSAPPHRRPLPLQGPPLPPHQPQQALSHLDLERCSPPLRSPPLDSPSRESPPLHSPPLQSPPLQSPPHQSPLRLRARGSQEAPRLCPSRAEDPFAPSNSTLTQPSVKGDDDRPNGGGEGGPPDIACKGDPAGGESEDVIFVEEEPDCMVLGQFSNSRYLEEKRSKIRRKEELQLNQNKTKRSKVLKEDSNKDGGDAEEYSGWWTDVNLRPTPEYLKEPWEAVMDLWHDPRDPEMCDRRVREAKYKNELQAAYKELHKKK